MKKTLFVSILVIIGFSIGWFSNDYYYDDVYNYNKLEIYQEYYIRAENLLDTLEKYNNWVDCFDPYDYYESLHKIDSINN